MNRCETRKKKVFSSIILLMYKSGLLVMNLTVLGHLHTDNTTSISWDMFDIDCIPVQIFISADTHDHLFRQFSAGADIVRKIFSILIIGRNKNTKPNKLKSKSKHFPSL